MYIKIKSYVVIFMILIIFMSSEKYLDALSWKQTKLFHLNETLSSKNSFRNSAKYLDYFSNILVNDRHFELVLNKMILPRKIGSFGHKKVRQSIIDELSSLGWHVDVIGFEQNTVAGPKKFHNVVATLDRDAPRRLVVACHYDMLETVGGNYVGATDSAVPCAIMLNIARSLRYNLEETVGVSEISLQLIFFDGEEAFVRWSDTDSTYGSRHMAANWHKQSFVHDGVKGTTLDRMEMLVLLDLIGHRNTQFSSLSSHTEGWYLHLVDIERQLLSNKFLSQRVEGPMFRALRGPHHGIEDDHIPFQKRGVRILHLISYPFPPVWHTPSDNIQAIDFETVKYFSKVLRVFIANYLGLIA